MSALQPSIFACFDLNLPSLPSNFDFKQRNSDIIREQFLLNCRTGAADTLFRSNYFVSGGLTIPLNLHSNLSNLINKELDSYFDSHSITYYNLNDYISPEIFFLDLITRNWKRIHTAIDNESIRRILNQNNNKNNMNTIIRRFFHSICYTDGFLYLFGGLCISPLDNKTLVPRNDLWKLNLNTKIWSLVSSDDNISTRFGASMFVINEYKDQEDSKLVLIGGFTFNDKPINSIDYFNLRTNTWEYSKSTLTNIVNIEQKPTSIDTTNSFFQIIEDNVANIPTLVFYSPCSTRPGNKDLIKNNLTPIVAQPLKSFQNGIRLQVTFEQFGFVRYIPYNLTYLMGASYANNLIFAGYFKNYLPETFHCFCYNIQSRKYVKINTLCQSINEHHHRYWNAYIWKSHHQVLFFGSKFDDGNKPSVQKFDHILIGNLPVANTFLNPTNSRFSIKKSLEVDSDTTPSFNDNNFQYKFNTGKDNSTESLLTNRKKRQVSQFENYLKYVTPSNTYSSLGGIFPNYAIVLGKDLMNKFGQYIADFAFQTLDGDFVPVPGYLLRKRWGRYFNLLFSHAYVKTIEEHSFINILNGNDDEIDKLQIDDKFLINIPKSTPLPDCNLPSVVSTDEKQQQQIPNSNDKEDTQQHSSKYDKNDIKNRITTINLPATQQRNMYNMDSLQDFRKSAKSPDKSTKLLVSKIESLSMPRILYLPWSTVTVKAFVEFFFTGQINSKWELAPVILNLLVIGKIYHIPILYVSIQEALFAIIKKKEDNLKFLVKSNLHNYKRQISKTDDDIEKENLKEYLKQNTSYGILLELQHTLRDNETGFFNEEILQKTSTFLNGSSLSNQSVPTMNILSLKGFEFNNPIENERRNSAESDISPHDEYIKHRRSTLKLLNEDQKKSPDVDKSLYLHEEDFIIDNSSMSDSSDIQLGGFSLDKIKKQNSKDYNHDSIDPLYREDNSVEDFFEEDTNYYNKKPNTAYNENTPVTLESLTCPNSLPPVNYIIKSIFRSAELVDDKIIMLRSLACLQVSTLLEILECKHSSSSRTVYS